MLHEAVATYNPQFNVNVCQVNSLAKSFVIYATTANISLCYARGKHLLLLLYYHILNSELIARNSSQF